MSLSRSAISMRSLSRPLPITSAFLAVCGKTSRLKTWNGFLKRCQPVAARLYHEERFMRGLSIFDESVWSGHAEMGTVLIWTAIEILFDLSGEPQKTKAICSALSEHVASDA
jgi:hypothetical protein